jgi:hypothetical protein
MERIGIRIPSVPGIEGEEKRTLIDEVSFSNSKQTPFAPADFCISDKSSASKHTLKVTGLSLSGQTCSAFGGL